MSYGHFVFLQACGRGVIKAWLCSCILIHSLLTMLFLSFTQIRVAEKRFMRILHLVDYPCHVLEAMRHTQRGIFALCANLVEKTIRWSLHHQDPLSNSSFACKENMPQLQQPQSRRRKLNIRCLRFQKHVLASQVLREYLSKHRVIS